MRSREALPLGCFSCGNVWSGQVFAYLHDGAAVGSDSGVTGDSLCGLKGHFSRKFVMPVARLI